MKLSILLSFAAILASTSAFALEFKKIRLQNGSEGWFLSSTTAELGVMPMTEQVADLLASLNPSRAYLCDAKMVASLSPISSGGIDSGTLQVFELKNCAVTH